MPVLASFVFLYNSHGWLGVKKPVIKQSRPCSASQVLFVAVLFVRVLFVHVVLLLLHLLVTLVLAQSSFCSVSFSVSSERPQ